MNTSTVQNGFILERMTGEYECTHTDHYWFFKDSPTIKTEMLEVIKKEWPEVTESHVERMMTQRYFSGDRFEAHDGDIKYFTAQFAIEIEGAVYIPYGSTVPYLSL